MNYFKITTSAEVYAVIFARHKDQLVPLSSFSDPDGTFHGGPGDIGRMDTEYGFKSADAPLIGISTTWEILFNGSNFYNGERTHQYWLCLPRDES